MREYRERNLGTKVRKEAVFVLFTILLVMVLAMFVSETVMSQTESDMIVDEQYYVQLETEYVHEIRTYLAQQGFEHSGVTLTRIIETDGSRNYEVILHHKDIQDLNQESQLVLMGEVKRMAFEMAGCSFKINLL